MSRARFHRSWPRARARRLATRAHHGLLLGEPRCERASFWVTGDNALRRPSDVAVLTAAEWRAAEGTALYREVVMHGIRFHLPS